MEFIKDLTRKVTDTARVAAKKSSDMVEITKLNFSIGSEEDKIKKIYMQIGETVYRSFEKGEEVSGDLKELCEKVSDMKKNIEKMKQQILKIKGVKICPSCKGELPEEVAYCPKCGTKQEVVVSSAESKEENRRENNTEPGEQDKAENSTGCNPECNAESNVENNVERSKETTGENKEESCGSECPAEQNEKK